MSKQITATRDEVKPPLQPEEDEDSLVRATEIAGIAMLSFVDLDLDPRLYKRIVQKIRQAYLVGRGEQAIKAIEMLSKRFTWEGQNNGSEKAT